MIPLTLVQNGEVVYVKKIGGSTDLRKHLIDLGFVENSEITMISARDGNVIVAVKGSRLAVVKEMASKIRVSYEK